MSNYNKTLQANNTDLQAILNTINALPEVGGEQATPEISVATSGLITATAGNKSSTYQLAFQAAKTITPSTVSQVAVSSGYYTGGNITVAGDSNLVAGNIKSGVSIFGVSGTAQVGGGTGVDDASRAIIERTVTEISDDEVQIIGAYAFRSCTSLTSVSFPACTSIGTDAFENCTGLTIVSFPACTSIGYYAFENCTSLTSVSFPACTSIGANAFCSCYSLTTASFPECTSIRNSAFYSCSKLTTANFPKCTSIGSSTFANCYSLATASFPECTSIGSSVFYCCSSLTTASFPKCTSIGSAAFQGCSKLTTVSFPVCTRIGSYAFSQCVSLTSVSFPACTSIGSYAFYSCRSLTTASFPVCTRISSNAFRGCRTLSIFQLGASSVCILSNSNAFSATPFAGYSLYFSGTPHIYVPASLITAYQSATNWTYFSSYFSAIESTGDNNGDAGDNGDTTLITFTINNIEYQAENGMTWEQFINSQYNTDNFSINTDNFSIDVEGTIMTSDGLIIFDQDFNPCNFSDLILNGAAYITSM